MGITSKTGLLAGKTREIRRIEQKRNVELSAIVTPAPITLKPYAGLYNPYPYGCSLLCNHPADIEAKYILKKAKDSWASDGKAILLPEELAAIRASYELMEEANGKDCMETVPEELFRRYTETDSRPLTPAPTLASGKTRESGSRRCLTPDPFSAAQLQEKTLLILDLRRSHSQETLSWIGSQVEPTTASIQPESVEGSSRTITPAAPVKTPRKKGSAKDSGRSATPQSAKEKRSETPLKLPEKIDEKPLILIDAISGGGAASEEDEFVKRKGKKRRKRLRDSAKEPIEAALDPETQVAGVDDVSHNPSSRPSLQDTGEPLLGGKTLGGSKRGSKDYATSFIDIKILKQLRRELTYEIVDCEFNRKKKTALAEALRVMPDNEEICDEMKDLQSDLNIQPLNSDFWLTLPRIFTRSSARFGLPTDLRAFKTLSPLEYLNEFVSISAERMMLYNCIFNRNKIENENEEIRQLSAEKIHCALGEMMGADLTEKQYKLIQELVGWKDDQNIDFRTWAGICAFCERTLAEEFCPELPDKKADPCQEIEQVDFEFLSRRVHRLEINESVKKIIDIVQEK